MPRRKKKNPRFTLPSARALSITGFGVGLLTSAAGLWMLDAFAAGVERATTRASARPTEIVVVAARDLVPGVPVAEDDVFLLQVPAGVGLSPSVLREPALVLGRVPCERIYVNELIRLERLADPESGTGLNAVIPTGLRALSIEIANDAALTGILTEGDHVDLLASFHGVRGGLAPVTLTVAREIYVLAVEERTVALTPQDTRMPFAPSKPSVTLLVTPNVAERVVHADATGTLRLVLRNELDSMERY